MKIWVDDIRTPPDVSWIWCKTSLHTVDLLTEARLHDETVDVMSLDHDLGEDDTTRPIVMWCCMSEFWPVEVRVHSANPVGIDWLEGMIDRYKPEVDSPPR